METEQASETQNSSPPVRQWIGLALGPLLFLLALLFPAPEGMSAAAQKVLAVGLLMASWWITEALPLPVTSLLPFLLFPVLQVSSPKAAAQPYAHDLIFLLGGGFFISQAMVRWNLHRRIALAVIHLIGLSPSRLVLGFMVATASLSMWISNTASTLMLYPIGMAVLSSLHKAREKTGAETAPADPGTPPPGFRLGPCLMLGIAYGASIGGVGTVIGTAPNAIMVGMVEKLYGQTISFTQWMRVGLPTTAVLLPIAWLWLTRVVFRLKGETLPEAGETLREEKRALGRMGRGEKLVLAVFVSTALAWIFREPKKVGGLRVPGLNDLLPGVADSTIAIMAVTALFLLPVSCRRGRFLLTWREAVDIPWGVLILLGGGLSLAEGFQSSGLAQWMGQQVYAFHQAPLLLVILGVVTGMIFLTEITSNTATTALLLPLLAAFAQGVGEHPLLIMMPATLAASYAFMLPAGTPPNAIVYGSGFVSIGQMVRAGLGLNILAVLVITAMVYLSIIPAFHIVLGQPPVWAK